MANYWKEYPVLVSRYKAMKYRCLNPSSPSYKNYGGRGIKICERWLEKNVGYKNYYEDIISTIGLPPSSKHELDRIDNNGDYELSNMRWATSRENLLNRRYLKPSNTGHKGVSWDDKRGRYRCVIHYENVVYFIGNFFTQDEACLQYEFHYRVLNTLGIELNRYERQLRVKLLKEIEGRKHQAAVAKLGNLVH